MLIRYRHHGDCEATLAERRSAGAIGGARLRSGIKVLDHLVVVSTGKFDSGRDRRSASRPVETPFSYHQTMSVSNFPARTETWRYPQLLSAVPSMRNMLGASCS